MLMPSLLLLTPLAHDLSCLDHGHSIPTGGMGGDPGGMDMAQMQQIMSQMGGGGMGDMGMGGDFGGAGGPPPEAAGGSSSGPKIEEVD